MDWQPPNDETLAEMLRLGMQPPASGFGRIQVVGVYEVPFFNPEEITVVEIIERRPAWMICMSRWWPYSPPGWDDEWAVARPDFYLSEDGQELIGSYLHQPPIGRITRFAIVVRDYAWPQLLETPRRRIPALTPIPERLLRLIWIDG
jgi:hypothetical protein